MRLTDEIKMKFDFDNYKGNYVMHCKTEDEAKGFCRVMHDAGKSWNSGDKYINDSGWEFYKENTCYNFNNGTRGSEHYFKNTGRIILEWSDFMNAKFTKSDLKDGMVGISRQNWKYIFLNGQFMGQNGHSRLCFPCDLKNDLTVAGSYEDDIMRICESSATTLDDYFDEDNLTTIWERNETVEMTIAEIEKKLGIMGLKIIKEN